MKTNKLIIEIMKILSFFGNDYKKLSIYPKNDKIFVEIETKNKEILTELGNLSNKIILKTSKNETKKH